jgi:hypothetical protein
MSNTGIPRTPENDYSQLIVHLPTALTVVKSLFEVPSLAHHAKLRRLIQDRIKHGHEVYEGRSLLDATTELLAQEAVDEVLDLPIYVMALLERADSFHQVSRIIGFEEGVRA